MDTQFLTDEFLLDNDFAQRLFHEHAERLPIIDFHAHLVPEDIAADRRFSTMTGIWLSGDHYKWRAMRACGVEEKFITGSATDREKFQKWAETVPKLLRNPLYHWTHLELRRPFGISGRLLNGETAREIWNECNALLATPAFSAQKLLEGMNVEVACTTDDPADSLEFHGQIQRGACLKTRVCPTFRPDRAMAVEHPEKFRRYIAGLAAAADIDIGSFDALQTALRKRHDVFHKNGCRASDHGLETFYAEPCTAADAGAIFAKVLGGGAPTTGEILKFKSAMLYEFAVMDWEKGWVQQFHVGALRNTNPRMLRTLGPDTGFDSIGDFAHGLPMAKFLGRLEDEDKLAKTILYNMNPADNAVFSSMTGNFQDGRAAGKIQHGAAWWFLDQRDGIVRQIESLSAMGVLSQFVGMTTDSRSFLSFPRHEYFRRILCNMLGTDMQRGLVPRDVELIGGLVRDICYNNAKRYFGFDSGEEAKHDHSI